MPTGKDTLNAHGLMMAARQSRDVQARVVSAMEALRSQIANSEEFARRLDEAIMRQNHRAIITLIEEVGLPSEAEVQVLELDPDRKFVLRICFLGHCLTISLTY
jgi:hypothetical protein